jgi:hypothetical protein
VAELLAAAVAVAVPDARSGEPAAAGAVVRLGPVAAVLALLFAARDADARAAAQLEA